MAAVEVPQTLEYMGGQLNVAPVLEVKNFTNWKKRFLCHIIGIEPQFENIIKNGPFILMTAGQRKPENQWTRYERKATNLDQRLKSLIMFVLPDDQMNSVINCLTAKSTWDDLILYHEGSSDVKESRVMDLKLCYSTFKFKEDYELASLIGKLKYKENLIDSIYDTKKNKSIVYATPLSNAFFSSSIVQDFQDSPDDEKDTRSSQEYLNDLEKEYQARALLAKSKIFFRKGTQRFSSTKATDQTKCHKCGKKGHFARDCWPTKDFEAKYNKVKAKLALLSSSASASKAPMVKNKGLIVEAYEWDEEEVSSDDNEMVEVKVRIALAEENNDVGKESARNSEWVKIFMRKILVLKQAKLDFLTMQHVNTEILKERFELKELKEITKTWLNSSNKVNQSDDTKVTIPGVERPWLSEDEGFILPNHDTGRILPAESQRNKIDPSVAFTDSSATNYDSADESSVCSTPLPPLKKLEGVEPISGPKTIKSILKSKASLKAEALKGVIINEPSSAPAKGNKISSASKVHSALAG
ncbi:retrovirus-related pol polyprotein from transposon TNT 1-94 [Tanacetum coccineum]